MTNQPFKRTRSMELRAIRDQIKESPPPAPAGASMREWFTGLALMNPALMHDVPEDLRAHEAVRLADEVIRALMAPKTPSQESMSVPTEEDGLVQSWNHMADAIKVVDRKERQERDTKPPPGKPVSQRTHTLAFGAILPPPMIAPAAPASQDRRERPTLPSTPTAVEANKPKLQRPPTPMRSLPVASRYALYANDARGPVVVSDEE